MKDTDTPLTAVINDLSKEDRANLAVVLELGEGSQDAEICETIRWLYHSKVRSAVKKAFWDAGRELEKLTGRNMATPKEADYPIPTWNQLIEGLADRLEVYDKAADLATNEKYICQGVIVAALKEMNPSQRDHFFRQSVDLGELVDRGAPTGSDAKGALRGFTVLGLAQAAGFSLYTSSATALSFLSGSIGVTLPFAAYTGLSTFLSVVTGPLGWIAMGGLTGWMLTSPEWRKLTFPIVCIINSRARRTEFPEWPVGRP